MGRVQQICIIEFKLYQAIMNGRLKNSEFERQLTFKICRVDRFMIYNIYFSGKQMKLINGDKIRQFASAFEIEASLQAHFRNFQEKYKNTFYYNLPNSVLDIVAKVNKKILSIQTNDNEEANKKIVESFAFGELKVFSWVLAVYCYEHCLNLETLKLQHFEEIQTIFANKSLNFIRYQALCLAYEKSRYSPIWSVPELQLLTSIVMKKGSFDEWRLISYELFCLSEGKYYRPYHQCREKWLNHLDPRVKKGQWTIHEDIALLSAVQCLQTRWVQIYRQMGGVRTQHMIKNRYKSIIKFWKKKYDKASPKKIVSNVLKHLKKKLKNGETDNSFYEDNLESSISQKKVTSKRCKKFAQDNLQDEEMMILPALIEVDKACLELQEIKQEVKVEALHDENATKFNLGLNQIKIQWSTTVEMESEKEINYKKQISRREYCFQNKLVSTEERKTSDSDDYLDELPQFEDLQNTIRQKASLMVPIFDDLMMVQSDSDWIRNIQDRCELDEQQDFFYCL